jgi:DNA-binding CsgD family transcriptional regulator
MVQLSPRQIQCIKLIAEGLSDAEIAFQLGISTETVREYIEIARVKYGAKRRIQLVLAAIRDGYFTIL